jgi:hypothetical protein
MALDYKVLGQIQGTAAVGTYSSLGQVPSGKSWLVSTISICNQAASAATFRIAVRPSADESTAAKHWIVYGTTVAASDSTVITMGLTLAAGDKIQVFGSSATLSFSAYGSEIS